MAYSKNLKKYYSIDEVVFHDGWSAPKKNLLFTQNYTITLPSPLKLIARAHELNVRFVFHSCGHGTAFLPDMIEARADAWQLQISANPDIMSAVNEYGKDILFETYHELDPGAPDEQVQSVIDESLETYGKSGCFIYDAVDIAEHQSFSLRDYLYKRSRLALYQ